MKKNFLSMMIVGLLCTSAFPFKFGMEFQAGDLMLFWRKLSFLRILRT